MANFGELKAVILRDLQRDDVSNDGNVNITEDTIEYYVLAAIDHFKTREFWFNQKISTSVTIAANSDTVALPSDFIQVLIWRITTNGAQRILDRTHYTNLETIRAHSQVINSTAPDRYAIYGEAFEIFPQPTQSLTTKLSYVFELTKLSNDADTNEWTNAARMLIAAKARHYIYSDRLHNSVRAQESAVEVERELTQIYARSRKNNAIGMVTIEPWM